MKSVNNKNNFILKFYCIIVAGLIFSCYIFANNKLPDPELKEKVSQWKSQQPVRFLENKGQMADADNIPIPFVLFKASANDIDVYITEKGVTYVFTKVEEETSTPISVTSDRMNGIREEENVKAEMAWINVQLKGVIIKKENIVKEGESAEHFNFFYSHCPDGIYNVKQYEKITIKNVYPDIDWVFYNSNETGMKYDFIVRPGADPSQIKLIYESENVLTINKDGNINIKTPLGTLTENAPYSYIEESGVEVKCDFTKKAIDRHNVEVGFNLNWPTNPGEGGNPCPESTLVIDPQLVWGTLYGGNGADGIRCLEVDNNNNLFAGGYTYSTNFPLQDAGTYFQVVKGINYDASILRFGNAGNLIWATFYGGSGSYEGINTIAIDANNNIFVGGDTDGIIFPVQNSGTFFQGARSGTYDAFILKFNNTGLRLWGTYYGGSGTDWLNSLAVDNNNNIYAGGYTNSSDFPVCNTCSGYFQATNAGGNDAYILKFDNVGNRIRATYYGGTGDDRIHSIAIDGNNNLYAAGYSASADFPVCNACPGYFQAVNSGGNDGVLLKFDNAGSRVWTTYYGGTADDLINTLALDNNNNLFVGGKTNSTDLPVKNVSTFFQATNAGGTDVFLLKFDNTCNYLWGTYFGGTFNENFSNEYDNLAIDGCGNCYFGFDTNSNDVPAFNPGQGCGFFTGSTIYPGGSRNSYITKFSNTGILLWTSSFGISVRDDFRAALAVDNTNNLFIAGEAVYYNDSDAKRLPLLNPGGGAYFDDTPNGSDDFYILKFTDIVPSYSQSQVNRSNCSTCNGSATINVLCGNPNYNYLWSNGSQILNTSGVSSTITGLCAGTYTVTITDAACLSIPHTVSFIITAIPCGALSASSTGGVICTGGCTTISSTGSGGTPPYTYSWNTGAITQNINPCPVTSTTYTVTVTDSGGNTATSTAVVTVNPAVTVTATSTNITCSGTLTGSVTATPAGGTPVFNYVWSNGITTSTVSNLAAGNYTVTVIDSKGCTATSTTTITAPTALIGQYTKGTANCSKCGCKEWVMVNAIGGTAPYTYIWPDGYDKRYKNQLCPGAYIINVKDKNGCSVNLNVSTP